MNTPSLDHIVLTVTDLERSKRFYGDLLGFEMQYEAEYLGGAYNFVVGGVEISLAQHRSQTPDGDRFNEFRVGLDHLSFRAPDEQALHDLVALLRKAGVETTDVSLYAPSRKKYVVFRDPDHIQLEYWLNESI
jgi:catechol 2,3-dioxygenase-like lactoylglutathione lyase family enzyme